MLADLEKEADQLAFDAKSRIRWVYLSSQIPLGQKQKKKKKQKKTMELGVGKTMGPRFTEQAQGFVELITWYTGLMIK